MATDDYANKADHLHEEHEWEEQKENFRKCYMETNMTLKAAADYMRENYDFDATPRQWERRVKNWGWKKYSSREDRLLQIATSGKDIYELSRPGRRPRVHSESHLRPDAGDERNLRRFARREVSRSRSRSDVSRSRSRSRSNSISRLSHGSPIQPPPGLSPTGVPAFEGMANIEWPQGTTLTNPNAEFTNHLHPSSAHSDEGFEEDKGYELPSEDVRPGLMNHNDMIYAVGNDPVTQNPLLDFSGDIPDQQPFPTFDEDLSIVRPGLEAPLQTSAGMGNTLYNLTSRPSPDPFVLINQPGLGNVEFSQFAMGNSNAFINPHDLSNTALSSQHSLPDVIGTSHSNPEAENNFMPPPTIQFDLVGDEMSVEHNPDLTTTFQMLSDSGQGYQDPISQDITLDNLGFLQTDVRPLLDDYIASIQEAVLWSSQNHGYQNGINNRLATSLDTSCQTFLAGMHIRLDNYMRTRQRSLQDVRDTCAKLRQQKALLEQMLMNKAISNPPSPSLEPRQHRASLPSTYAGFNNPTIMNF